MKNTYGTCLLCCPGYKKLIQSKCYFMANLMEYLGHLIDATSPNQSQSASCAKCTDSTRHYSVEILSRINQLLQKISFRLFFIVGTPK